MSTVMLLLAMHPDHQQTLFDELKRVMPHKDTDLTASHLNQLDFTTRCIKESLRLFPTVPFIARTPDQPIKINGIVIPAGVPIIMANGQIHRREEYWGNDAKQFNPNRFLRPECRPECQVAGSMLGFSYGPRNCIGMPHLTFASLSSFDSQIELLTFNQHFRFYSVSYSIFLDPLTAPDAMFDIDFNLEQTAYYYAMATMKTVVAHTIRNYRLTTPLKMDELKFKLSITYRLLNTHLIQVHERTE